MKIPKVIHFIWTGPPVPGWVDANIERWRQLNPGYTIIRHGEEALAKEYVEM